MTFYWLKCQVFRSLWRWVKGQSSKLKGLSGQSFHFIRTTSLCLLVRLESINVALSLWLEFNHWPVKGNGAYSPFNSGLFPVYFRFISGLVPVYRCRINQLRKCPFRHVSFNWFGTFNWLVIEFHLSTLLTLNFIDLWRPFRLPAPHPPAFFDDSRSFISLFHDQVATTWPFLHNQLQLNCAVAFIQFFHVDISCRWLYQLYIQ